ncbi:hypothetical protein C8R45DRAFT_1132662 [Mycena sanguinolenta]|nr:hypothetical protein C8R45DRAFT_1151296 [Mycena sanguinolenta]KAJ6496450.1 hypothetical protein C8R45DRAFT_1132662 [Mycena sanguinolenta]
MRYHTAFVAILSAAVGLVRAVDDRLLYQIPAGDTMATFTAEYAHIFNARHVHQSPSIQLEEHLLHLAAAIAQGLTSPEAFINPGDFQGKNADTEALIFCAWTNGTTFPTFTTEVAASLGATELTGI